MQAPTIHYIPPIHSQSAALRVAAYCRVSSDSFDQLESYAAQVEHYTQLISQTPQWELADIYADEGLTGTRADTRADFQRLLKDCRRGRIDKVLVKSISRFARNIRDCLTSIRELKSLGVEVFFEKERIDTSDMGSEMMLSFYASAAQEESLSISSNMRWSYQHRMKNGEFITCSPPYGYRLINGTLVIDWAEAPIVQRIFREYLSGISTAEIARRLQTEGAPIKGNQWARSTIKFILRNEKYAGNALLQKRYTTDELPFQRVWNKGERTMYYVENSHPAIITQELFERAQQLMKQRNIDNGCGKHPFSLTIFCGCCGSSFKRRVSNETPYWVCRSRDVKKENCSIGWIPECAIEQAFLRLHHKLRTNYQNILTPMAEQLSALAKRASLGHSAITDIDNQLLQIGRQSMLLHRLFGDGHMDAVHFHEQSQAFNQQVNTLRRQRRQLLEDSEDESAERTNHLIDLLRESPKQLHEFNCDLFHSMVQKITVSSAGKAAFALMNGLEVTEAL